MISPFVSRPWLAMAAALGAAACVDPHGDLAELSSVAGSTPPPRGMFLPGELRVGDRGDPGPDIAPPGAHLIYFGGRIVSNIQVVQVIYGAGSYIPEVTSTATPSMASFYQGVLNSAYVDWLTEYNTTGQPSPTSDQVLGRGSFESQVTITPSASNNGTVIDDTQIQAELSAQIQAGALPAPSHDAAGNNNTYYAVFFPHGKTLTLGGLASCQVFCAYHGTIAESGGAGEIYYGVHPDFQVGSGCENGCGAAASVFGNYTQVASHELVETMTDPEVGLATVFGPPLAWADLLFSEIGDICNDQNAQVVGGDGVTYDVQTEFSNSLNDCVATNPLATPLVVTTPPEQCAGSSSRGTVTLLGGAGRFTTDVALSLAGTSPMTPDITAAFDPNPVPAPADSGGRSIMQVSSARTTPAGTYTLSIQAVSAALTATTTVPLVVRSAAPAAPVLSAPANGSDGVSLIGPFAWNPVDQATQYELDVFAGSGCGGPAIRTFTASGTSFTLPGDQALDSFESFSWHVSANNACGGGPMATSACFDFRTASCSEPREQIANGGFEGGLGGWTVSQNIPPPAADGSNPHAGKTAVLLGTVTGTAEPLGDAQVSQVITVAAGAKLTFEEWPLTTDSVTFDQQYVRVTPLVPPGPTVALMNEARNDQNYIARSFDLSPFSGMTIQLTFGVHQDGFGDITGMFIDEVSVVSPTCGPPDFALRIAPATSAAVCAGNSLQFTVSVDSVNGPNFNSPVTLTADHLPPGATAQFADNPVAPGSSTILTVSAARPTDGTQFTIEVHGAAVMPPPTGTRTSSASLEIDPNSPDAPEIVSPRPGEVNVPRRPTLSWSSPFVPDATGPRIATGPSPAGADPAPMFLWQLAATAPPHATKPGAAPQLAPGRGRPDAIGDRAITPLAFGAAGYHIQVARDAAFTSIVADATVDATSFTLPVDLDIATRYFWRVSASNACGTSAFSATGSFIVGACFEGWVQSAAVPIESGPSQATVIASPADQKLYIIGGGIGPGPTSRIDQTWAFDPQTSTWTRRADVPAPGIGSNFGAAALVGHTIYTFGGVVGPPQPVTVHRALWKYDIIADSWTRGADMPSDNFGTAVAALDGQIYLAYGSGFTTQAWRYDPSTDSYTRLADPPAVPQTVRLHAVVLAGEIHAFAGGFEGSSHVIYNPGSNTWRVGPAMPFTATDPAVGVLGGKAFVVGGRPIARAQVFDPVTSSWSQSPAIISATGVDNTAGAVLGTTFHLIGGFDGLDGVNTHWQFHACNVTGLSSAALLPFAIDGNGRVAGVFDERTAVLIDNSISGAAMSVSCFLFGTDGQVLGNDTFQVLANEQRTITDVVRALTHTSGVQNTIGSIALFGTELFHTMASVVNNSSSDPVFIDGQSIAGSTSGYVSTVGSTSVTTHTVFANASPSTSVVQVLAYPAAGGDTPLAGTVAFLPPHGAASFPDIVARLGLPTSFSGQLSWSASQPIGVMARDMVLGKAVSGVDPVHSAADASSTAFVSYVEDSTAFASALELGNPGPITANVTVRFVEVSDATGGSSGIEHTRDLPVAINRGAPVADIVRWTQHDASAAPSGKHGFLVVTTPQAVTAQAKILDRLTLDPVTTQGQTAVISGFSPLVIRVDQLPFSPIGAAAAATPVQATRLALSNPGSAPVTVQLVAFNASGSATGGPPFTVTLAPDGQFFTENLGAAMQLPPVFLGWVSIQASGPVLVFNHRRTSTGGAVVPTHDR